MKRVGKVLHAFRLVRGVDSYPRLSILAWRAVNKIKPP